MANYGNTGQRYKMPKINDVTLEELKGKPAIYWHLSCGHVVWHWVTYEGAFEHNRTYIGTRTRCNQCTK